MLLIKLLHISRSERKPRETNLGAESFCHGSCRSIAGKAGAAAAVEVCVSVGRGFGRKLDLCGETSSNPDKRQAEDDGEEVERQAGYDD